MRFTQNRPVSGSVAALLAVLTASPLAPAQDGVGVWDPPLEWEFWVAERDPADPDNEDILFEEPFNTNKEPGQGNTEWEFSHAVVVPTGSCQGWVIIWRLEKAVDPDGESGEEHISKCWRNTSVIWAINPASPEVPVAIYHDFDSDIFCAGQSWDELGQLVVAGGIPGIDIISGQPPACTEPGPGDFPSETYRFKPGSLGFPEYPQSQPGGPWPGPPFFSSAQVVHMDDGVIGRYYPLVGPLFEGATYFAGTPTPFPGGGNMLIGGPPGLTQPFGNEVWEIIRTRTTDWELPMVPVDPDQDDMVYGSSTISNAYLKNSPLYVIEGSGPGDPFEAIHTYGRDPANFPDRLLDSYPRMYQLPGGEMLIWGDVPSTTGPGANAAGMTWVITPDFDPGAAQDGWVSALAKTGQGNVGGGAWHDSFYDSGILLQELDSVGVRQARVLVFGGSRDMSVGSTGIWDVSDEIWQFNANVGSPQSVTTGAWNLKFEDIPLDPGSWVGPSPYAAFKRLYANAVILPTGEVFVVGGTSVDDYAGMAGHATGDTAPVDPIIYDPGDDPGLGSAEDDGIVYEQPGTYAGPSGDVPILPRLYHSTAVLLPDGRVLAAGGKRTYAGTQLSPPANQQIGSQDPRYTGQIFRPPYLDFDTTGFGSRPIIEDVINAIDFGSNFMVEVTRRCDRSIDAVVLIRPAALTHHFDQDQRYVELAFSSDPEECSETSNVLDTLTVTAPGASEVPPGFYMLFVVETDGSGDIGHRVPSIGTFVRLK